MTNLGAYLVDPLVDAMKNKLLGFISNQLSFERDVEDMEKKFEEVRTLLEDAERKSLLEDSKERRMWLKRIKDAAYDMEDVLEDISLGPYSAETAPSSLLSTDLSDSLMKKLLSFFSLCRPITNIVCPNLMSSNPKELEFRRHMGKMMKGVKECLDKRIDVVGLKRPYSSAAEPPAILKRPRTFSTVDDSTIFGRDDEKNNITNLLLDLNDFTETPKANRNCHHVIAIVGIGGLGKTALAKLVFNDKKIRKECESFDIFLWVSVPVDFDLKIIFRTMLMNLGLQDQNDAYDDLEFLTRLLHDHLQGKKVFLVMDDVWSENRTKWNDLMSIMKCCKIGSKILLTTRNEAVARSVQADHVLKLQGLSNGDSWKVFCSKAFDSDDEIEKYTNLRSIGKDITESCKGVPLAINALGAILHDTKSAEYWRDVVRDRDIWKKIEDSHLDDDQKVMSSLK